MSDKKIITLGKRATGRSSLYEKSKKEYKELDMCGKNAQEVIEKQNQSSGGVLRNFAKFIRKHRA